MSDKPIIEKRHNIVSVLNVRFVPKADVRSFSFWKNFFAPKLGEGKRGRYYIGVVGTTLISGGLIQD